MPRTTQGTPMSSPDPGSHETTDGKVYQERGESERHQAYLDLAALIESEGWSGEDAKKLARILVAKAEDILPILEAATPPVDEAPTSSASMTVAARAVPRCPRAPLVAPAGRLAILPPPREVSLRRNPGNLPRPQGARP